MNYHGITYASMRSELWRRVFQYAFCGPLLLAWSIGVVVLVIGFQRPLFALIWTGAVALLGALMAFDNLQTPKVRDHLIRTIVQKQFSSGAPSDDTLKAAMERGINACSEIFSKVLQWGERNHSNAQLHRLIPLTNRMVSLLRDSIAEAAELKRGLVLARRATSDGEIMQSDPPGEPRGKRQAGVEEVRRDLEQACGRVSEIVEQLEGAMLSVFQLEHRLWDPWRSMELVREAEEIAANLVRQIGAQDAERCRLIAFQQTREELEAEFSRLDFPDGLCALQSLAYEYSQLQPLLARIRATDSVSLVHHLSSLEETYRMGLGLLTDALDLLRAVHPSQKRRLEEEIIELQKKVEPLKLNRFEAERIKLTEATVTSHAERLDMMQKQQLRIEELLQLAGVCEASLHRARMELASLKSADSESGVTETAETLRKTIEQAKEMRAELKKLGL